jgi:dTDP-4-amino-4,6-dideoxygalactose transaminase
MQEKMRIPFSDSIPSRAELEELRCVFRDSLQAADFVRGQAVEAFEQAFSEFCEARHCVGVGLGTDALRFALVAAGLRTGESVITVPNAFGTTSEAISQAGGLAEFVDVDERTYNIDVEKLWKHLETGCDTDRCTGRLVSRKTGRTIAAIVPVHMYGQPANMDPIMELAEGHHLVVIEDACQAPGAEYFSRNARRWMKTGSIGHAAAFSFSPETNLGAFRESGAVTTNDSGLADKVRMLRNHEPTRNCGHEVEYNGGMNAIEAGLLSMKLHHLADWNGKRRRKAEIYQQMLSDLRAVSSPFEPLWTRSVNRHFVIGVEDRERLREHLSSKGIETGLHNPTPLHLRSEYRKLGYRQGDFPVAEASCSKILSLPIFPSLTRTQQEYIAESVMEHFGVLLEVVSRSAGAATGRRSTGHGHSLKPSG